jgi:endoglucanase
MDHPALVIERTKPELVAVLRGGVYPEYVHDARVQIETSAGPVAARIIDYKPNLERATLACSKRAEVRVGDIVRWWFPQSRLGVKGDRFRARACDDLAGAAAALAALDTAMVNGVNHMRVLLTRAEEVGLVGAIAACELGALPSEARVLSIECSRAFPDSPVGGGPIVRVGDASSVFSHDLTNRVTEVAKQAELPHQRKLMAGGTCEATAFAALGYEATGLCLALDNYHNMAGIDKVRSGEIAPRLAPEEISLSDFHGLVALLEAAATGIDDVGNSLPDRLRKVYRSKKHILR